MSNLKHTDDGRAKNHGISNNEKKHAVLLLAIVQAGGTPSKQAALDLIERERLYRFSAEELQPKENRPNGEEVWRNNFAFRRKDLETRGFVDGSQWDVWGITDAGRRRFEDLLGRIEAEVAAGRSIEPLTPEFLNLARRVSGPGSASCDETSTDDQNDKSKRSRSWSGGEQEWHRNTVEAVAADPKLIGANPADVVRTWKNSVQADDGTRLWKKLLTSKRPDVVFETRQGELKVIEVEPVSTAYDGIGQLAGDYAVNLQVDRHAAGMPLQFEAILVTNGKLDRDMQMAAAVFQLHEVTIPERGLLRAGIVDGGI